MKQFFHSRPFYISSAIVAIGLVLLLLLGIGKNNEPPLVTAVVETGTVRQLVSVSGTAEAQQTAELAFPVSGIVTAVLAEKGDVVSAGDILVTLDNRALLADRQDAVAALNKAVADRDELISGPSSQAREVTSETVRLKKEALETTTNNETRRVVNAYATLLSSDLEARTDDPNENAVAPTITGTYTCDSEGTYTLTVFSSGSDSGYSYTAAGLESGIATVSTNQPSALGDCGLYIQFDPTSNYNRSVWNIQIPNTSSAQYVTNLNAYNLAKTQAKSAIALAAQDLTLSEASASNTNAPARAEALTRSNASVTQAQARLARIDSTLADLVLRAPFAGTITAIDVLPGETVTNSPIVTLLADETFDVTALIPEIDIGKLATGQKVEMMFDARSGEVILGEISYISLKATLVDGVSYYEAIIQFAEVPSWIRSGLNTDVDIIISEQENVLRVPSRFVSQLHNRPEVLRLQGEMIASTSVAIVLDGDDGWVAITGVNEGDIIVAP